MNMQELSLDLTEMGVGENLPQAELIYLYIAVVGGRLSRPLLIDGSADAGKEYLIKAVTSLFPDETIQKCKELLVFENNGQSKMATICVGINNSDAATESLLRLNREKWTLEGLNVEERRNVIRSKHRRFQEDLACNKRVIVPYEQRIIRPKGVTALEEEILFYFIEGIVLIDQAQREEKSNGLALFIEAKEQDFYDAKTILSKAPVLDRTSALSSDGLEFAKLLLWHRDSRIGQEKFTRSDLMRVFKNRFQTFKPIGKRLEELIEAGFIEIIEKRGYKNSYGYSFSEALKEADESNLVINRYRGFKLS